MSDSLWVVPNVVVAGLLPNNPPPPKVELVWLVLPNSPVPDDGPGVALLAVDPKVPPLPNVAVLLPPPPNAPNPVEGLEPPNRVLEVLLGLLVFAKAPVDASQIMELGKSDRYAPKPPDVPEVVLGVPRFPNMGLAAGCCCWF